VVASAVAPTPNASVAAATVVAANVRIFIACSLGRLGCDRSFGLVTQGSPRDVMGM
jgi:hypothetical protein